MKTKEESAFTPGKAECYNKGYIMKPIIVTLILSLLTFGVGSVMGSSRGQGNNCQVLVSEIADLETEKADLQAQLQVAPTNQKSALAARIKSIIAQIATLKIKLQACQAAVMSAGEMAVSAQVIEFPIHANDLNPGERIVTVVHATGGGPQTGAKDLRILR